jgi:trans-aconitate methyltransferase
MQSKMPEPGQETAGRGVDATGDDYDSLPYLSLPVSYTRPNHLAALAALFGLPASAPEQARILELGCASGGNIMPLAVRFPQARFLGVDLSARQIADGRRRIAALGLTNIELRCDDIGKFAAGPASFDYVICHGVYSWVRPAVQDAIFRIVSAALADGGVAAVSYNVLPGWHLKSPLRDMLLAHAGTDGTPRERVQRAREMLGWLETATGTDAYGALLREEAKRLARMPASYILGEFLAKHNAPVAFDEFADRAARHGLSFLCEADLDAGAMASIPAETRRHVAAMTNKDPIRAGRSLDLFSGRPFRRSLLVKAQPGRMIGGPLPQHLAGLHIACGLTLDQAGTTATSTAFTDRWGRNISTKIAGIGETFRRLAESYPATLAVDELAGAGAEGGRIKRALLNLLLEGRAGVSVLPIAVGRGTEVRPVAWASARAESALGLPFVTNLHHVTVELSKVAAAVTARLDGTRTPAELVTWLVGEMAGGKIVLPEADQHALRSGPAAALAERLVAETLRHLAASAVLIPAS